MLSLTGRFSFFGTKSFLFSRFLLALKAGFNNDFDNEVPTSSFLILCRREFSKIKRIQ